MHFITGKQMERRTFLRGAMGAAVALPFLDAMVAAKATRSTGAAAADRTRLICVEEVHGLAGCNKWGASKFLYAPEQTGANFTIVPDSALSSLEPYREHMTIISNTDVRMAEAFTAPEIGGDHFRSSAVFLTQSHPKQTQGSDIWAGTSFDQMYAQHFGQATPMPSMQFCIESLDQAGGCTYNYSCAYTDSISWASPNEPLPMIRDPRVAFDMLFGSGSSAKDRADRRVTRRSILDWIQGEVASVRKELGTGDRTRLDRYLNYVREIERRARIAHHRQRLARTGPADGIGVDAGVTVGAAAGLIHVLDAQLHRRDRRRISELLRVDLVERHTGAHVRALGLPRMRLGQEHRARAEVVRADFRQRERLGVPDVGVADDGQVVAERFERRQRAGAEVERGADFRRRPEVLAQAELGGAGRAVHHLDRRQAHLLRRGAGLRKHGGRGRHCVQHRQRHRDAKAAQHRAA